MAYSIGTYAVEKALWGVKRRSDSIDAGNDIAIRCTGLNKHITESEDGIGHSQGQAQHLWL